MIDRSEWQTPLGPDLDDDVACAGWIRLHLLEGQGGGISDVDGSFHRGLRCRAVVIARGIHPPRARAQRAPIMSETRVPWAAVFGSDRPVEVEIGPGRGDLLLALAAAAPATNFFAIERAAHAAAAITEKAAARRLANVRVVAGDARCVVRAAWSPRLRSLPITSTSPIPGRRRGTAHAA